MVTAWGGVIVYKYKICCHFSLGFIWTLLIVRPFNEEIEILQEDMEAAITAGGNFYAWGYASE